MTIGEENEWVIGMKRYEKMSKEEIIEFLCRISEPECGAGCVMDNQCLN